ncbi:MAG: DNA (cytosine-5-)-methyltransferase, partial [Bacillota bacterium]
MAKEKINDNQSIDIPLDSKTLESIYSYSFVTGKSVRECTKDVLQYQFEQIHNEPIRQNTTFTFIDLFAGIGGMRIAFEEAGGQCVFSSEWDKYSQKTYFENFGVIAHGDITRINAQDIPDHDVLVAGFPCQPFSIAGVSKKNSLGRLTGFLDKTQGTLFFDIVRIINAKRPKAFLLENVKNLMSHDKGRTYKIITESLNELDYEVTAKVMDGQHY